MINGLEFYNVYFKPINLIFMNKAKYTEGLQMAQFKRIEEISHYNYNYYIGFDKNSLNALRRGNKHTGVLWLSACIS